MPLQRHSQEGQGQEVVSTQWDMGDVEKAGLLKMDFLGPAQPDQPRNGGPARSTSAMPTRRSTCTSCPLDDPTTFELLQRGETKGVFQLDGAGIRDLLVKMKPDRFADLIAHQRALSSRPAQRRHGR